MRSTPPALPLAAPLQARLCWVVSCWWAFGGGDGGEGDQRCCVASYTLLCQMLLQGADLAVRLQAALTLHTLLQSAADDDLRLFAPMAPQVCTGLGASLAACETDEAIIWLLRVLGKPPVSYLASGNMPSRGARFRCSAL